MAISERLARAKAFLLKIPRLILTIYVAGTLVAIALIFAIGATPFGRWLEAEQRVGCTTFDNLRAADAIVILGGDPGSRALAAAKAFRAGKAPLIIVSADEYRISDSLRAGGIPDSAVKIDPLPQRTIDHPETILQIPGITRQSSLIVTSSHLQERRAKFLFERAGYSDVQVFSLENDFEIFRRENPDKFASPLFDGQRLCNVCYAYLAWLKYYIVD